MSEITVFVRRKEEADGVYLGLFEPSELENLLNDFKKFKIYFEDTEEAFTPHVTGQWVCYNAGVFFEIVVDDMTDHPELTTPMVLGHKVERSH